LTAKFDGSDRERLVLDALLYSNYARRTVTGIAKDTQLDKAEVKRALNALTGRGIVAESQSTRTGALLYQVRLENIPR
jgi:predicted transcriptional regulator